MDLKKLLAMKKFTTDQTQVSLKLAKQVIATEAEGKNLVFSPLSIHVILGLIAAGSTGQTRKELLDYLKSNSSEEFNLWLSELVAVLFADGSSLGGPRLSCTNVIWVAKRFEVKPGYKKFVENSYKAVLDSVDFANRVKVEEAVKKVNQWAEAETNGLIKEVLSSGSVDALTRLIFGNAVYFKGAWVLKFPSYLTQNNTFFLLNGGAVRAPFMTMNMNRHQYASAFNCFKVLRLPYKTGADMRSFSMYIFLPDATNGLPALVQKATSEPGFIEHHLPHKQVPLKEFRVPKFKVCSQFNASKVLKELGLVSLFRGGLTEMVDENLNVLHTSHKSFIEVNEHGTEAAAVTISLCGGGSDDLYKDCIEFVTDHPFLFIIREDTTGMLLFMGQVVNPLLE